MAQVKAKASNAKTLRTMYEHHLALEEEGKDTIYSENMVAVLTELFTKYGDQDDDVINLKFNQMLRPNMGKGV